MAAVYHNDSVDIELESGTVFRSFLNHTIGSGDNNANWYGVRVFRNGEPVNLTGCSVQGIFMPSSGSAILISDSTHTWVSENEAAVLLPQACYNVKGQFTLAIKIIGTTAYTTTGTVRIVDGVVADTYSENPVAETETVPTYQEILAVYDQMVAAKDGSVRFDIEQELTAAQMTQARGNIAAASESDVSDLKSALHHDYSAIVNTDNLFVNATLVENKYYAAGEVADSSRSYFIVPVENGVTYKFNCAIRFISRKSEIVKNTETPTGGTYTATASETLYFTVQNNQRVRWQMCENTKNFNAIGTYDAPTLSPNILANETGESIVKTMTQKSISDNITNINGKADNANSVLNQLTEISPNLLDMNAITDNVLLIADTGAIATGYTSYFTTDYIPVAKDDIIHHQFDFNGTRYDNVDVPGYTLISRVCGYDSGKTFVSGSGATGVSSYTVPNGVSYIRLSFEKSASVTNREIIIASTNIVLPYTQYGELIGIKKEWLYAKKDNYYIYQGSYSEEIKFTQLATTAKSMILNCVIHFSALPAFSLGLKNASNTLYSITVDSSKLYIYDRRFGTQSEHTTEYSHGLTISNDLSILAEMDETGGVIVSICSQGEKYTIPNRLSVTRCGLGYPFFSISSGSATYVSVSATVKDLNLPIWLFGDSYLSDSSARWAYYLNRSGANGYMIDAYPGEGSLDSVASLKNLLTIGTPKFIVWCIGMNDGSDNGAPTSRWKDNFDTVKALCEANYIEMIVATIPTVPEINHEYKNAYVRASGLRYIDFAKAVNASASGVWYSGMLSDDNVHPTEKGAKALFFTAMTDFPQLSLSH